MTDLKEHRKNQAKMEEGLAGGTIPFALGLVLAGLWQLLVPQFKPFEYRLLVVGWLAFLGAFIWRLFVLGGADPQNKQRDSYLLMRKAMEDNGVGSIYARGVRAALAKIDAFFGDAGRAGEVLWPRAFGLKDAAPLWTAQSYDRCLMLALVYPLAVMLIGWVVSGEVLALERALEMKPGLTFWQRVHGLVMFLFAFVALRTWQRSTGWEAMMAIAALFVACLGTFSLGAGYGALLVAITLAGASSISGHFAVSCAFTLATPLAIAGENTGDLADLFTISVVGALALKLMGEAMAQRIKHGLFLVIFTGFLLLATFAIPLAASAAGSERGLTLLFFVGLLTLINAPFDWAALGISRGLLRRGLERGDWAPLWLGLLDIIISLVLMFVLALTVLWASQLFDWMTLRGGNQPILKPETFLTELGKHGALGNTHYWWLYTMLFSTQIPALVNLLFGLFCLLRGYTGMNGWMLRQLPETGNIALLTQIRVAAAWSSQLGLAVALGLLGVYWLIVYGIGAFDPLFGATLIEWLKVLMIPALRLPGA